MSEENVKNVENLDEEIEEFLSDVDEGVDEDEIDKEDDSNEISNEDEDVNEINEEDDDKEIEEEVEDEEEIEKNEEREDEENLAEDDLQIRIQKLTERVEELTTLNSKLVDETANKEEDKSDIDIVDFMENSTVDDLIDDSSKFNEMLNTVLAKAVEISERVVTEKILSNIPDVVSGYVDEKTSVDNLVSEFYKINSDLTPVKRTVKAIASEIHADNPDWKIERVFKEAAIKTREVLGLPNVRKKSRGNRNNFNEDPAFAKSGGGKLSGKRKVSKLQEEIDDLFSD
jgi:DNA repair exonuclease SbcCD ATPase subunit